MDMLQALCIRHDTVPRTLRASDVSLNLVDYVKVKVLFKSYDHFEEVSNSKFVLSVSNFF